MTQTQERPTTQSIDYDAAARTYIQAFQRGEGAKALNTRPADFGPWEKIISAIERNYFRSDGDVKLINNTITTLCKTDNDLASLLRTKQSTPKAVNNEPPYPALPASVQFDPKLAATACKWLDEYIAFSKKWSPRAYEDYHEAVGLSLLSAIAGHRVSFAYGQMEYTPLYIALVGFTTLFKKTTTARLYYGLINAAGLDWILGANISTPQKLLTDMAGKTIPGNYDELPIAEQERVKKRLAMCAQRGWYYDEFGLHLDQMVKESGVMGDFKGLLRILDDCMPVFENATQSRGLERIENPYLSLLASMTPADIKPHAEKNNKFWRDGLFARFCFICPPRNAKSKRERFPKEKIQYPASLVQPLQRWHDWLGVPLIEIVSTTNKQGSVTGHTIESLKELPERECISDPAVDDALDAYEYALLDMVEEQKIHESLYGSYGRLHKLALRIAMLLASLDNKGKIELRHWARGQQFAEARRRDLHELFMQVNSSDDGAHDTLEGAITDFMQKKQEDGIYLVTTRDMQRSTIKKSGDELKRALQSLARAGEVELVQEHNSKNQIIEKYRLIN